MTVPMPRGPRPSADDVLRLLAEEPLTRVDLGWRLGCSLNFIDRTLRPLRAEGRVVKVGEGRGCRWRLPDEEPR